MNHPPIAHRSRSFTTAVLVLSSLALWAFRRSTGVSPWDWYLWNLLLALVPWATSGLMLWLVGRSTTTAPTTPMRVVLGALGIVWLLFYPNAPYLLTDVVHLPRPTWSARYVIDGSIIALFAAAGAAIAVVSFDHVRAVVAVIIVDNVALTRRAGFVDGALIVAIAGLSAFGISLGRLARSNSWDVLHQPLSLVSDVLQTATSKSGVIMTLSSTIILWGLLRLASVKP